MMKKRGGHGSLKDHVTYRPVITVGERCMNPWNGKCSNTDIALYIMFKGRRLPICRKCWREISSKDIEWRYK
ncbi:hypothetical protein CW705_01645 [Candidatus Bathyarchaeota archaeon]|nr:MAG: hypothetical protein CW705_01645 [Candidatus Bathyarchaeota archaeon]